MPLRPRSMRDPDLPPAGPALEGTGAWILYAFEVLSRRCLEMARRARPEVAGCRRLEKIVESCRGLWPNIAIRQIRRSVMTSARDELKRNCALGAKRNRRPLSLFRHQSDRRRMFSECNFSICRRAAPRSGAHDAAPWIDLWRDSYASSPSRVAAGLRQILAKFPRRRNSVLPLPAFLRACEAAKLPLTGPGLVALATMAFQEVKTAFREQLRPHAESDGIRTYCRRLPCCSPDNFDYPKFDEYTYPSADLQIRSRVRRSGRTRRLSVGPGGAASARRPASSWRYWSCPDKPALQRGSCQDHSRAAQFSFWFLRGRLHRAHRSPDFRCAAGAHLFRRTAAGESELAAACRRPRRKSMLMASPATSGCAGKRLGRIARLIRARLAHSTRLSPVPICPRRRILRVCVAERSSCNGAPGRSRLEEFPDGNFTGLSARSGPRGRTAAGGKGLAAPYLYSPDRTGACAAAGRRVGTKTPNRFIVDLGELSFLGNFSSLAGESRRAGSDARCCRIPTICPGRKTTAAELSSSGPKSSRAHENHRDRKPERRSGQDDDRGQSRLRTRRRGIAHSSHRSRSAGKRDQLLRAAGTGRRKSLRAAARQRRRSPTRFCPRGWSACLSSRPISISPAPRSKSRGMDNHLTRLADTARASACR